MGGNIYNIASYDVIFQTNSTWLLAPIRLTSLVRLDFEALRKSEEAEALGIWFRSSNLGQEEKEKILEYSAVVLALLQMTQRSEGRFKKAGRTFRLGEKRPYLCVHAAAKQKHHFRSVHYLARNTCNQDGDHTPPLFITAYLFSRVWDMRPQKNP